MGGRLHSRMSQFVAGTIKALDGATEDTAQSGLKTARIFAPFDSGALKFSGKVENVGLAHRKITFGDGGVPYARRREYENYKNPHRKHYLERGGDAEVKKLPKAVERRMEGLK